MAYIDCEQALNFLITNNTFKIIYPFKNSQFDALFIIWLMKFIVNFLRLLVAEMKSILNPRN